MAGVTLNWNEIDQSILAGIDALQAARDKLKSEPAGLVDLELLKSRPSLRGCLISSYFVDAEHLLQMSRVQVMIARSISAGATFPPAGNLVALENPNGRIYRNSPLLELIGAISIESGNAGLKRATRILQSFKNLVRSLNETFRRPLLRGRIARRKLQRFVLSAIGVRRANRIEQLRAEPHESIQIGHVSDRPPTSQVSSRTGWLPFHAKPSTALIAALCFAGGLTAWTATTGVGGVLAARSGSAAHTPVPDTAIVGQRSAPSTSRCSVETWGRACYDQPPRL